MKPGNAIVLGGLWLGAFAATLRAEDPEALGIKLAPGFRISVYADADLANDTYAMTLDAQGRVVITTQGSVKTLYDDNRDGRADRSTLFTTTPTGGMGLCFVGNDLLFCGDNWLSRYRDANGDGRADGPPEHIVPLRFTEHGGHAMRKGPDGWFYVVGGNDAEIDRRHVTLPNSPVNDPEAGGFLRLTPDLRGSEVIAQGFRNPYDFDFNAAGDLFTYDSDTERDEALPWYSPTRIYHVEHAGHHGWRVRGYMRSWARRPYYLDTVDILWPVGRGSPTGVTVYRHHSFPAHYQGGVFALDWTFGKVYFFRLNPDGTTYQTKPEVFIEPIGTSGFDPTDIVVAPDGSIYLSIGGRRTRGAVYHIEPVEPAPEPKAASDLDAVLRAPQPLDAWSRARWEPIARRLGAGPLAQAVIDEKQPAPSRVRAVEVLTDLFEGLDATTAQRGARSASPEVRARVAWSLGRVPGPHALAIWKDLAGDAHPRVRLATLSAWADRFDNAGAESARGILIANLGHTDKRVRQAAARLAAKLPDASWQALLADLAGSQPRARLSGALAAAWRDPQAEAPETVLAPALEVLAGSQDPEFRLDAVRLIMMALGDYRLVDPPVEAFTAYMLARPVPPGIASRVLDAVRPTFPSGDDLLNFETARLLAMLEDNAQSTPRQVASFWSETSSPTRDVHYLIILARLRGPRDSNLTARTANALLSLDRKFQGRQLRIKQSWAERLVEVVAALIDRDPGLPEALLAHPDFARPAHVPIAMTLKSDLRPRAAKLFWDRAQSDPEFAWTPALVELFGSLPVDTTRTALRAHWDDFSLRDAILLQLARSPEPVDRVRFVTGLESSQPAVLSACLDALQSQAGDPNPDQAVPVLRLLRRLTLERGEKALRAKTLALLSRQLGHAFEVTERSNDPETLKKAYEPVFTWFAANHPRLADLAQTTDAADLTRWSKTFQTVDWSRGEASRGEALFRTRACVTCHTGWSRVGPDLTGAAARFSRDDLLAAIVAPNRDVAPQFRVVNFETKNGQVVTGIVIFESADGYIVQTSATETVRLATDEITATQPTQRSMMPTGLLDWLSAPDIADLYAYLQTLRQADSRGR